VTEIDELKERMRAYGALLDRTVEVSPLRNLPPAPQPVRADRSIVATLACIVAIVGAAVVVTVRRTPGAVVASASLPTTELPATHGFSLPVRGALSTKLGTAVPGRAVARLHGDGKLLRLHVQAVGGSEVLAIANGWVTRSTPSGKGQRVVLDDANGATYTYESLDARDLASQWVRAGEPIGTVTNNSNPGFDLQIAVKGLVVDPLAIVKGIASLGPLPVTPVHGISISLGSAPDLKRLLALAASNGLLLSGSGYRNPESQLHLRKAHCGPTVYDVFAKPARSCTPPTALVGSAGHGTGTSVYFVADGRAIVRDSKAHQWLLRNAGRFNFVQPHPSEPWHWEHRVRTEKQS
jgi:hypothetical protein